MHIAVSVSDFFKSRKIGLFLLALFWCLGAFFGILVFRSASGTFSSLMRSAAGCPVSIVGVLIVCVLPFLITVFAASYSKLFLIFTLCFIKAFSYSIGVLSVFGAFGTAGWLLQLLLMFTENGSMILLWVIWCRVVLRSAKISIRTVCCYFAAAILVAAVDILLISPFTVSVIIF